MLFPFFKFWTYLEEARSPVQVEVQVFNFTKVNKLFVDVVFLGLFVNSRHKQDPSLNSCNIVKPVLSGQK